MLSGAAVMPNDEIERSRLLCLANGGRTYGANAKRRGLAASVKEVFYLHRRRYGARRIYAEPKAAGIAVGRRFAETLMKEQTLTVIRPI